MHITDIAIVNLLKKSASEVQDGLTLMVEQASAVLDSCVHIDNDNNVSLFEVTQYERIKENDYMNFSCCENVKYSDYKLVKSHYFTTREEMLTMMFEFTKSENHF